MTTTDIIETLLDPDLDRNVVATTQPVGVESNAVFIVDLKYLKHTKDIMCDELGSWKNNGCHNTWVIVDANGIAETCGKVKPNVASDGSVPYRVCKKYYVNKASQDFRRMIVFLEGMHVCSMQTVFVYLCVCYSLRYDLLTLCVYYHHDYRFCFSDNEGDLLSLALVHYTFENEEHIIMPRPHGNSKSQSAYVRTLPSTLQKLRDVSQHVAPKHAVSEVSRSVGGLSHVSSVSQLPRNRQQSADCRSGVSQSSDPLFPVMIMCKETEGAKCDPQSRFVRIVCNTPEPMAVLVFDWTLEDLERFCTDPQEHVVLSVDPTFNLGSFHVTVTTYQHPMLEFRHQRRGNRPVMFGPMFIHQRKTFGTYNFFFSQLVGLKPKLQDIQCFGTDGEKALEDALRTQFKYATHLRCFLHFRGNIESKLSELCISKSSAREFIHDIFGNPVLFEEGLVDADADSLDAEFEALKSVWDERECALLNCSQPQFHSWFRAHSLEVVRNCMLKSKRESAGLGSPPDPYYTNDVESKNRVLKHQNSYKPHQLPEFVQSMKSLYEDQKQEIDKAIVGIGEYKLSSPYMSYGIEAKDWFKKSQKQRERILDRFGKAKLSPAEHAVGISVHGTDEREPFGDKRDPDPGPSNSNPLQRTKLPASIQQSIWAKVQSYLEDESSYSKSPGVNDYTSVLVKSSSSERPHFVTKKSSSYKCDSDCLMFKSTNGLCSHSLLAASLNGEVNSFVTQYVKTKDPINYAALGQHGLPTGGKKPNVRRKASSKKATSAVKSILAAADEIPRTKRANKEPIASPSRAHQCSMLSVSTPQDQGNFQSALYGVMANTVNFSTPGPPPLLHFSPESAKGSSSSTGLPPSVRQSHDPSSVHLTTSASSVGQPFVVMFLNARISRCQGCRGKIEQGQPSPGDIVLQHKEHVLFQNPRTGSWQMSKDLRNTYYHPRMGCIAPRHPDFSSSEIQVRDDVRERLNRTHVSHLNGEFGLVL